MKTHRIINQFFDAVCGLATANYLTGVWDNRRFQLCKKPLSDFFVQDYNRLYETEKKSRFNVEQRGVYRKEIDRCFKELVTLRYNDI